MKYTAEQAKKASIFKLLWAMDDELESIKISLKVILIAMGVIIGFLFVIVGKL